MLKRERYSPGRPGNEIQYVPPGRARLASLLIMMTIGGSIGFLMGYAFLVPLTIISLLYVTASGVCGVGVLYGLILFFRSPISTGVSDAGLYLRFRFSGEVLVPWVDVEKPYELHKAMFGMFIISVHYKSKNRTICKRVNFTRDEAAFILTHPKFPYSTSTFTARSLGIKIPQSSALPSSFKDGPVH